MLQGDNGIIELIQRINRPQDQLTNNYQFTWTDFEFVPGVQAVDLSAPGCYLPHPRVLITELITLPSIWVIFSGFFLCSPASVEYTNNFISYNYALNPCPAEPGYTLHCKQCRSRSVGSESALFAIKYVNLYEQYGSINLIG